MNSRRKIEFIRRFTVVWKVARLIYNWRFFFEALRPRFKSKSKDGQTIYIDMASVLRFPSVDGIRRICLEMANYIQHYQSNFKGNPTIVLLNRYGASYQHIDRLPIRFQATFNVDHDSGKIWSPKHDDILIICSPETFDRRFLLRSKKFSKVKVISFLHDVLPITNPQFFPEDVPKLFQKRLLNQLQSSDACLSLTQKNIVDYYQLCSTQHNLVSPNTEMCLVSTSFLDLYLERIHKKVTINNYKRRNEILEEIFNQSRVGLKSFLFVGTIEPRKGLDELVRAIDSFQADWVNHLAFILIGRVGWATKELIKSIQRLVQDFPNNFVFIENAADELLFDCYQNSSYLLMPSYQEGFGLPLIEASHFDCPILARDTKVFREVSKGKTLFFGEMSSDYPTLREALLSVASSRHENFVEKRRDLDLRAIKIEDIIEGYST